ncbi:MAG: DNA internalization-related competence protein ComEC/Rec2 [Legionellaceae bacterium]|nr:DNA internalization-related competence protein ComEC/Rec2 [Legionellaceae bacterium]
MEIIAFLLGILAVYYDAYSLLLCFCIQCLLCYRQAFLWCFCCGAGVALLHQYHSQPQGMPEQAVLQHALLSGKVLAVSRNKAEIPQFELLVSAYNQQPARARVLLRCYQHCPTIEPGQFLQVDAKLKKPRNLGNPGAFDFVRWAAVRHIDWTGYVRPQSMHITAPETSWNYLQRLRSKMADNIRQLPLDPTAKSIVLALTLGMGEQLSRENWQLFRQTGTAHLMVISGAHIGLVAGLLYLLTGGIWRWIPNACLWIPAQRIAAVVAIAAALAYALISGFAVPAQRALIACILYFARFLRAPFLSGWQIWRYAMLGVLLYEPHAALQSGFYLSFTAVAILLFANRWLRGGKITKSLCLQMYCLLGLLPLTEYCFGYGALNGFVANLVAIPLVGLIVVPLSLISALLAMMAYYLPKVLIEYPIHLLLFFLTAVDQFSWLNPQWSLHHPFSALLGSLLLCASMLLPKRWFLWPGFCLLLSIGLERHSAPPFGDARMDVLDVGQGLAVLIETQHHRLLYDSGGKFYQGSDMGVLAILPYLKTRSIDALDYVVISHPDLDHRGGLVSLEAALKVGGLIVDDPLYYKRGLNCHVMPAFEWDGVHFEFLNLLVPLMPRNNHSCVLRVYNTQGQFLLTGDIERDSEQWLVEHHRKSLPSTVLLAPHHGSKTSSSRAFLEAVHPDMVIISSGFDNRFHFPHPQSMRRYRQLGLQILNTAEQGMISVHLRDLKKPSALG